MLAFDCPLVCQLLLEAAQDDHLWRHHYLVDVGRPPPLSPPSKYANREWHWQPANENEEYYYYKTWHCCHAAKKAASHQTCLPLCLVFGSAIWPALSHFAQIVQQGHTPQIIISTLCIGNQDKKKDEKDQYKESSKEKEST
jgi:hypothetical protein